MQNNTGQIFISVVMPVYNAGPYLTLAIDSILNQTHKNFEFIIINDGSTDNSKDIITAYQDNRIIFKNYEEHQGIVAALNYGLSIAKGEFVARMDADDESFKDRFSLQLEYMLANPDVGILGTQYVGVNGKTRPLPTSHDDIVWHLLSASPFVHNVILFRSSFLKEHQVKYDVNFQYAEDLALWVELCSKTKMANLDVPLITYFYHNGTHRRNIGAVAQLNTLIKIKHIANLLPELDNETRIKLANYLNRHVQVNYSTEWFKQMLCFFDELIKLYPKNDRLATQLNNCVWFHSTSSPSTYFKLFFTINKYAWVKTGLVKFSWLIIKLIK